MVDSVKLAQLAVSLGDCETLIELPAAMTHRVIPEAWLTLIDRRNDKDLGGLEHYQDIIEDLRLALGQIFSSMIFINKEH